MDSVVWWLRKVVGGVEADWLSVVGRWVGWLVSWGSH